jgi:hypothetical protein
MTLIVDDKAQSKAAGESFQFKQPRNDHENLQFARSAVVEDGK